MFCHFLLMNWTPAVFWVFSSQCDKVLSPEKAQIPNSAVSRVCCFVFSNWSMCRSLYGKYSFHYLFCDFENTYERKSIVEGKYTSGDCFSCKPLQGISGQLCWTSEYLEACPLKTERYSMGMQYSGRNCALSFIWRYDQSLNSLLKELKA